MMFVGIEVDIFEDGLFDQEDVLFGEFDIVVVLVYFKFCMDVCLMIVWMFVVVVYFWVNVFGYCMGCFVQGDWGICLLLQFDVKVVFVVCVENGVVVEINL